MNTLTLPALYNGEKASLDIVVGNDSITFSHIKDGYYLSQVVISKRKIKEIIKLLSGE